MTVKQNRMRTDTINYKNIPMLTFFKALLETGTSFDWSFEDPKIDKEKCGKPKLSQCGSS
jgi:hypothetical protein